MKSTQDTLRNLHKRRRLMTQKSILWNADQHNLGKQSIFFCGRKFRFTNCVNAESIDDMKLKIKDHYAAVVNYAPSDNQVKVFSDSSPFTNKYVYSFAIPEIRTALRK